MVLAEAPFNRVFPSTESPQQQPNPDQLAHATEFRANVRAAYAHTSRLREARQAEGLSTDGLFTTIVVTHDDVAALSAVGRRRSAEQQMDQVGGVEQISNPMITSREPKRPVVEETVFTGSAA